MELNICQINNKLIEVNDEKKNFLFVRLTIGYGM
jgi:hypothetical protein